MYHYTMSDPVLTPRGYVHARCNGIDRALGTLQLDLGIPAAVGEYILLTNLSEGKLDIVAVSEEV